MSRQAQKLSWMVPFLFITALEAVDEPTLLVFPGATRLATHEAVIQHALTSGTKDGGMDMHRLAGPARPQRDLPALVREGFVEWT